MASVNQKRSKLKDSDRQLIAHRIRLAPNNKQRTYFKRACGIKRLAYNWAKKESLRLYQAGIRASGFDLCKQFNAIKDQEFPFVYEVSKWAPQKAIYDFWDALIRYFKGKKGTGPKCGFPRFKKKGKCRDSFYIGPVKITGRYLHVPILGPVKMMQDLRFPGKIRSVTISRDADFWFAAVLVEVDKSWKYPHACKTQAVVGIDLGLKHLAILSDRSHVENPKWFKKNRSKLRRLNKRLSRRTRGSARWEKARRTLARHYYRISCLRENILHHFTTGLVKKYKYIGIENLNVAGMMKNHKLANALADASFGEIRRQLEYKAKLAGSHVVIADRWFASTQTCSNCGQKREMPLRLSDRKWICAKCAAQHDRDDNAAENLRIVAARYAETLNARGAEGSGMRRKPYTKPAALKRESGSCQPETVAV